MASDPAADGGKNIAGGEDFARRLAIEAVSIAKTRAIGRMNAGPQHANDQGWVHGGAIMGFADHIAALGAIANLPPNCDTTTVESKTNFLKAARPGLLTAEAEPVHIGRKTMVWQTSIYDASRQRIAIVTQTQMVLENVTRRPVSSG